MNKDKIYATIKTIHSIHSYHKKSLSNVCATVEAKNTSLVYHPDMAWHIHLQIWLVFSSEKWYGPQQVV